MDDALKSLLRELEQFGTENDAKTIHRQEKMLNVTPETGEFLSILIGATKSRRVLEIGTSNGYSTMWLADAVRSTAGSVVTLEVSAAKTEMACRNFERARLAPWVRLREEDAGPFLRQHQPAEVDLLFLDSDRDQYVAWWPWIQAALAPRGLLIVDNAVSHADEMKDFVTGVRATPGWQSVVVPIGNGELMALKPVQ